MSETVAAPDLSAPVTALRGVGAALAGILGKLGIFSLLDLLRHFPARYEDRSHFKPLRTILDGETAVIAGAVTTVENRPLKNKLVITKVTLDDGDKGVATLTFFNTWRLKAVFEKLVGQRVVAYGTVKRSYGGVEMTTPEWEPMDEGGEGDSLGIGRIVPVYSATEGISQNRLRKIIYAAVEQFTPFAVDVLPPALRKKRDLLPLADALRDVHFPADDHAKTAARRRLAYDELLMLQLLLADRKLSGKRQTGIEFADVESPLRDFAAALPFTLTNAQARVLAEIAADMNSTEPMNRLVQGDVGSGKTAVAMGAMLVAVRNGYQAALMAPTEILAEQHAKNLRGVLEDALGVRVDLLTGSVAERTKREIKSRVAAGETGVVVGTHALIQDTVTFARLGLAVVDEQHRFGVLQRAALSAKGAREGGILRQPDVLVMTATPIPRTLTLTVYGDLDVSIIDALPPGRKAIRTHWKRSAEKDGVYEGVRKVLQSGRQAFVVCPLVEESEKVQSRAATELAAHLQAHVFPEYRVGLLHGQMSSDEKDAAMSAFRANETQVLVATTVIEVGVDVPNAAVMVIEDADRFGLAQLHQLRGRVGRGQFASFCVLVADPQNPNGVERMEVLTQTGDGFLIAEADLRLRGPGEFYGVRQSGVAGLQIADVLRDADILADARADAFAILSEDKTLAKAENKPLREALRERRRAGEVVTAA